MRDNLTPNPESFGGGILNRAQNMRAHSEQRQNLESRATKGALDKDPHLRSSPILGEGKTAAAARAARLVAAGAIAIYRAAISPVIHAINGPACRFEPSCSVYARDAIAEYGIVRGGAMALWRVARCNPMGGHGFDPVRGREAGRG